jgi:hypothetical protein
MSLHLAWQTRRQFKYPKDGVYAALKAYLNLDFVEQDFNPSKEIVSKRQEWNHAAHLLQL